MKSILRVSLLLLISVLLQAPGSALIRPELTFQLNPPEWMAIITVQQESTGSFFAVCNGSLIERQWVLAGVSCAFDPFETIQNLSRGSEPKFFVFIGSNTEPYEVENTIFSPDFDLQLYKLNRPATETPIKRTSLSADELNGTEVKIYNLYTSEPLGNSSWAPEGEINTECTINGAAFFSDGRICYLLSPIALLTRLGSATATVIDPSSSDAPATALNQFANLNETGAELYLKFEENGSYPCYEDAGSGIIAEIDGEEQLVGVVSRIGVAAGMPLCNNSFLNTFAATSHYESFILESLAQGDFDSACPSSTTLRMDKVGENGVRLHWDALDSVVGYRLFYTTDLGYVAIESADVGSVTEISTQLDPATTYTVALQAYNDQCTGALSEPISILLSQ